MKSLFKYKYAYWAVMILAIILPWGELTKFPVPGFRFDFGVSTFLGLVIVMYGIVSGSIMRALQRWRGAVALIIFSGYTILTAQFSVDSLSGTFLSLKLFFYTLMALTFLQLPLSRSDLIRLLRYVGISGAAVVVISVLDRAGVISVPGFNLSMGNVKTGELGVYVKDMCGPFKNRSSFATYLSLYLPVILGLSQIKGERLSIRFLFLLLVPVSLGAVFLASSRGLFLGVIAIFAYFSYTAPGAQKLLKVISGAIILALSIVVFALLKPSEFEVFLARAESIISDKNQAEENIISKEFRAESFHIATQDLLKNPLGHGFGRVYFKAMMDYKNLHNSYLEFFHAGGPLGLILVAIAFFPLAKGFFKPRDVELSRVFYGSLLCLAVYNLTHTMWPFAMMWIYIGICMKFALPGWIYPKNEKVQSSRPNTPIIDRRFLRPRPIYHRQLR